MIGAGEYKMADLAIKRIPNDSASSVKIKGFIVDIYEHDNFGGKVWTFYDDVPSFVPWGCNDKMSSVKIRKRTY
jgi:hypothetical protein